MLQLTKIPPCALAVLFLLTAADLHAQPNPHYTLANGYAQGTSYHLVYKHNDRSSLSDSVTSLLQIIDQSLSLYLPNSLISSFNTSKIGIKADNHLLDVVKRAIEISTATLGAFDITCKPLMDLWGFGITKRKYMPSKREIRKTLSHCGFKKLYIKGDSIFKTDPAIQIDCNGIAQGYTVDKLAELLERNHIHDYMVELGGEIRVKGSNPYGKAWVIGMDSGDRAAEEKAHLCNISAEQGGITTSGINGKTRTYKRISYSHILDPRSGRPVNSSMIAVTVFAFDAMTADALDNAFMVMGPNESINFLKGFPNVEALLTYLGKDGEIKQMMTQGFRKLCIDHPEMLDH